MSFFTAVLVGCKDTNEDEIIVDYAEKIVGTFRGESTYTLPTGDFKVETKTYVNASGVNVVDVTIKDYHFSDVVIADLVVNGVKVSQEGAAMKGAETLKLEGTSNVTVDGKSVQATLSGTAPVVGGSISLKVSVDGYSNSACTSSSYADKSDAAIIDPVVKGICVMKTTLDEATTTINYEVPTHAREIDMANCEAEFKVSEGAKWAPKEGDKLDFSKPETAVVVTSEDAKTVKTYTFKRVVVEVEDLSPSFVNTYSGKVSVIVDANPAEVSENQKVIINRMGKNMVKLNLKNFAFAGAVIGDILVDSVILYAGTPNNVVVANDKVSIKLGESALEVDVDVEGTFSTDKEEVSLKIGIAGVAGMTISASFEGAAFTDPTATKPIFATISHSKILCQNFDESTGNLEYYVDGLLAKDVFADVKEDIKLPKGSTMKPTSTEVFDFTQSTVWYTVTSADGSKKKNYSITRKKIDFMSKTTFDFTTWSAPQPESVEPPLNQYSDPDGWQTPNNAVYMIKVFSAGELYPLDGAYPVVAIEEGKVGKAAQLTTLDTKGGLLMGVIDSPKVTSGTVYIGAFNFGAAMSDPLTATEFGLPYNGAKPVSVTGSYKYTPGPVYYDVKVVKDIVDQPSVSAVLYEVSDNPKATLTGKDIYSSPRIVASGLINPSASGDFSEFSVKLDYKKEYDPTKKLYKLAIIMSASKDGDKFKGAPQSTLVIDEVTIVTE